MKRFISVIALTAMTGLLLSAGAASLSETDAGIAASRWGRRTRLGVRLSPQRSGVRKYTTASGGVFYSVRLGLSGTVFVGDVGGKGMVLAFTSQSLSKIDEESPLYALISRSLSSHAGTIAAPEDGTVDDESEVDDLRVAPFIKTKWSQGSAYSAEYPAARLRCYNYYAPVLELKFRDPDGNPIPGLLDESYESPCGCVATAMAQTLRYWRQPVTREAFSGIITHPVTPFTLICQYDPSVGGIAIKNGEDWKDVKKQVERDELDYAWNLMTERPLTASEDPYGVITWEGDPVAEENCEAIGALCYDCGVAVGLNYQYNSTGLNVEDIANIPFAFTNVFGYASAILCDNAAGLTSDPAERARAILSNLDARRPALLLVSGISGGHAILADGYGFAGEDEMPFVHLNMGWAGQCDIWYRLPSINISSNPENFTGFSEINGVVYNIAPASATVGEIVSGRVVDEDGAPVEGVQVSAYDAQTGADAGVTTTDSHGIYYFVLPALPAGFDVFAEKDGLVGDSYTGPVLESNADTVGNSWGNDMTLGLPAVRAGATSFRNFRHAVEFAQRRGEPLVEVLRPCSLAGDLSVSSSLAIVATNESARLSSVVCSDYTSPFYVSGDARLLLSNIVFSAASRSDDVAVNVSTGATLAVAGLVVVGDVVTADSTGFEVAGPLECGFTVKCAAAKVAGEKFGTVFAGGEDYAAYIFNGYNLDLAGVADGTDLKWAGGIPVPVEAAFVVFDDGSTPAGYRSFDAMLACESGPGEMHLRRRCKHAGKATLSADRLLVSDFGDQLFADNGCFTVDSGARLTLTNVVVFGSASSPLFTLGASSSSTGDLVLDAGAVIDGFANTSIKNASHGGAVLVKYGLVKLSAGSLIDGCSIAATGKSGGGVYLNSALASLELAGGTITNCVARGFGGGVYAFTGSKVSVTGASVVSGNVNRGTDGDKPSDIYFANVESMLFSLDGDASGGTIGVSQVAPVLGDAFMGVKVDAQTATNSATAFFSDDADLVGAVSDDGSQLVWVAAPDKAQCAPERAVAFVVYAESGETNYYSSVNTALVNIRGDATVYVATNREDGVVSSYSDWNFVDEVEIVNDVKICTVGGAETRATIIRDPSLYLPPQPVCSLFVRPGGTLTLTNIVFDLSSAQYAQYAAIAVDGGTLVVDSGADVFGSQVSADPRYYGNRAAGAINVYNDGVLRMRGGTIRDNRNLYYRTNADYGVGAGVLVDNATAYFEGGSVVGNTATRYAGVYVGNGGKAYVSGAFTATGSTAGGAASNFAIQDLSTLVLAAPLAGTVGITDGVRASTNVFGEVGGELSYELIASATNFVHDTNGETGAVATNAEGKAFLVWPSAFPDGEDFFEEDDVVYYRVAATPPPPPPTPGYTIHYIGGVGVSGEMDDTECLYGKVYNLRKCTLTKGGARFVGWAWNGRLYDDGILIFNLSDVDGDELDFVAVWE